MGDVGVTLQFAKCYRVAFENRPNLVETVHLAVQNHNPVCECSCCPVLTHPSLKTPIDMRSATSPRSLCLVISPSRSALAVILGSQSQQRREQPDYKPPYAGAPTTQAKAPAHEMAASRASDDEDELNTSQGKPASKPPPPPTGPTMVFGSLDIALGDVAGVCAV